MANYKLLFFFLLLLFFISVKNGYSQEKTNPEKTNQEKDKIPENTMKGKDIEKGKAFYNKNCAICHGLKGEGGTQKAQMLHYEDKLFGKAMTEQTDGVLFTKITKGNGAMPAFDEKTIQEAEKWAIINYIRTFSGK